MAGEHLGWTGPGWFQAFRSKAEEMIKYEFDAYEYDPGDEEAWKILAGA